MLLGARLIAAAIKAILKRGLPELEQYHMAAPLLYHGI
jgi:hypothetical protein